MHRLMLACLALLISVSAMAAVVPGQINYQGFLTAPTGAPLDTVVNITFNIYQDAAGGLTLWNETHNNVQVTNGLFDAHLGETLPLSSNTFWRDSLWLGVTVGTNSEMTPRIRFLAVPYSYRVGTVDYATGGSILSQVFIADKANIGSGNTNAGERAFVAGESNVASGDYSTVGGGTFNRARGAYSVVAGGGGASNTDSNSAQGDYSFVGGGRRNTILATTSVIGGGYSNDAYGTYNTVAGGYDNTTRASYSTVGGGYSNEADSNYATIGGGYNNSATAIDATVAGGGSNDATAYGATVGGGYDNNATSLYATIPGGQYNDATGEYSFAAGRKAQAYGNGSFVWGDATDDTVAAWSSNMFVARASGGVYFYTNAAKTSGMKLTAGSSAWAAVSDSTRKRNIRLVDTRSILEKVARLPIKQWSYKAQDPSVEHVGPMAQDFWNLFHLSDDSLSISTIDPDGIALAAIQELHHQNQELQKELTALRARLQTLEAAQQQSLNDLNERSNHE